MRSLSLRSTTSSRQQMTSDHRLLLIPVDRPFLLLEGVEVGGKSPIVFTERGSRSSSQIFDCQERTGV